MNPQWTVRNHPPRLRTAHDLAAVARGRRLDLGWSQAETARRAGVSRKWVSGFETGKASVELAAVFRLLDALDVGLMSTDSEPTGEIDLDEHLKRYRQQ